MKFKQFDKKTKTTLATILSGGVLLGAAIIAWQPDRHAPTAEAAEKKPATAPAVTQEEHSEAELIRLSDEQMQRAGISFATAEPGTVIANKQLPGEIRADEDRTAHIVPRVAGVAERVLVDLGQSVRKGQVLAVIASTELAELRSTLRAAEKRLDLARLTYDREKKLWEDKISAEQDYLQARQAFREGEINVESARAKLVALGATPNSGDALNRFELRAPFDGVIVEKHLAQGEAVKEDANVFLVSDLSRVWVELVITAADLNMVRVGADATVMAAANDAHATGKVNYVGSLIGEQTRTAKARIVLDNPGQLWRPGLFVNVALEQGRKQVPVAVSSEAIQSVEGKPSVFVKTHEGVEARPIVIGRADARLTEVVSGLAAGTPYATNGSFILKAEQGKDSAEHEH